MPQRQFDGEIKDGFAAIPAGWYNAYVTSFKLKDDHDQKGAYYSVMFTISDGDYKGRTFWTNLFFHSKEAGFKTDQLLAATGRIKKGEKSSIDFNDTVCTELTGRQVRIKLGTKEWEGQTQNEVSTIAPHEDAPAATATAATATGRTDPRL